MSSPDEIKNKRDFSDLLNLLVDFKIYALEDPGVGRLASGSACNFECFRPEPS